MSLNPHQDNGREGLLDGFVEEFFPESFRLMSQTEEDYYTPPPIDDESGCVGEPPLMEIADVFLDSHFDVDNLVWFDEVSYDVAEEFYEYYDVPLPTSGRIMAAESSGLAAAAVNSATSSGIDQAPSVPHTASFEGPMGGRKRAAAIAVQEKEAIDAAAIAEQEEEATDAAIVEQEEEATDVAIVEQMEEATDAVAIAVQEEEATDAAIVEQEEEPIDAAAVQEAEVTDAAAATSAFVELGTDIPAGHHLLQVRPTIVLQAFPATPEVVVSQVEVAAISTAATFEATTTPQASCSSSSPRGTDEVDATGMMEAAAVAAATTATLPEVAPSFAYEQVSMESGVQSSEDEHGCGELEDRTTQPVDLPPSTELESESESGNSGHSSDEEIIDLMSHHASQQASRRVSMEDVSTIMSTTNEDTETPVLDLMRLGQPSLSPIPFDSEA